MKIYIAHVKADRKWVTSILVPFLEDRGFSPVLITSEGTIGAEEQAQERWRAMDACQALLLVDKHGSADDDDIRFVEMGLMLGWARHIIVLYGGDTIFAHLPWVIQAQGWGISGLDGALGELRVRLAGNVPFKAGDSCDDEGCPHYGTPHGHPEEKDKPPLKLSPSPTE